MRGPLCRVTIAGGKTIHVAEYAEDLAARLEEFGPEDLVELVSRELGTFKITRRDIVSVT